MSANIQQILTNINNINNYKQISTTIYTYQQIYNKCQQILTDCEQTYQQRQQHINKYKNKYKQVSQTN